jgi:hypothetical protein
MSHGFSLAMIERHPGLRALIREMQRVAVVKGYDAAHDDTHVCGELSVAAACYALPEYVRYDGGDGAPLGWPFELSAWKPSPDLRKRELEKAMQFLVAEWERIDRAEKQQEKHGISESQS